MSIKSKYECYACGELYNAMPIHCDYCKSVEFIMNNKIPPSTKEEECVRIVEELLSWDEPIDYYAMGRAFVTKALAAVKPKAKSPLTFTVDGVELDVFEDTKGIFQVKKGAHKLGMSDKDFDRVLVEGLKHRGVDLDALDPINFIQGTAEHKAAKALRATLDNAEAG